MKNDDVPSDEKDLLSDFDKLCISRIQISDEEKRKLARDIREVKRAEIVQGKLRLEEDKTMPSTSSERLREKTLLQSRMRRNMHHHQNPLRVEKRTGVLKLAEIKELGRREPFEKLKETVEDPNYYFDDVMMRWVTVGKDKKYKVNELIRQHDALAESLDRRQSMGERNYYVDVKRRHDELNNMEEEDED